MLQVNLATPLLKGTVKEEEPRDWWCNHSLTSGAYHVFQAFEIQDAPNSKDSSVNGNIESLLHSPFNTPPAFVSQYHNPLKKFIMVFCRERRHLVAS